MYRSVCIGVSKHLDPRINELPGAVRDARAVSALLKDNFTELQDICLLDEDASYERISETLQTTLLDAKFDDVVIIFFAGHGTSSHRLVTYNTSSDEHLIETTFAMQEIADLFGRSPARAVLLVLDCCFSGGASARVLNAGPIPRIMSSPYNMIAGEGRLLMAASAHNEPAWEDLQSGHGLFTKALIDELLRTTTPTDILELASRVQSNARSSATRLGIKQNPAVAGEIRGGLTIAPCTRGDHYNRLFPDLSNVSSDGSLESLQVFGMPETICNAWHDQFSGQLNSLQASAINDYGILAGESLLVIAPTSSGKTFIGEVAAAKAICEGKKAVFLFPYKALTNEKFDDFQELYGNKLGFRIIRCTGDSTDTVQDFVRGRYDLALLTYEMFLNLLVSNPHTLMQIGLVVLDEAQFIADPNRGINVELLLTNLVTARQRGITPQLLALSAVIGGINYFDQWLGTKVLISKDRPVPLREGVLDRSGVFQYRDPDGSEHCEQLLPSHAIMQRQNKPSSQDVIVPLIAQLLHENSTEKILVFRNRRGNAMGCAKYLANDLGLPPADTALSSLPTLDPSGASGNLREAFAGGTAFHTSDLTREEKQIVERAFRDSMSPVRVLTATTGVAAGINTPASTVILAEHEFLGKDGRAFSVAEVKNMGGRAGRLGYNERGTSILLADTSYHRQQLFERYIKGDLDSFRSSFEDNSLGTWVIKLLTQLGSVARTDVPALLANTYGGYLRSRENPDWAENMRQQVNTLIAHMESLALLDTIDDNISLTLLGTAVGRSSLSFESALDLVETLRSTDAEHLTPENLVALLQSLPEMDDIYTPMCKKGQRESAQARDAVSRFGDTLVQLLHRHIAGDQFKFLARCKRAAILYDWMAGVEVEQIEAHYTVRPYQAIRRGDIQGFGDVTRYHLRSAADILLALSPSNSLDAERLEEVLMQLEMGLPPTALQLLELPIRLGRGELLNLYRTNILTVNDVIRLEYDELRELIGEVSALAAHNALKTQ